MNYETGPTVLQPAKFEHGGKEPKIGCPREEINWVIANYEILNIEKETINNYINNASFLLQVVCIRNYINKK